MEVFEGGCLKHQIRPILRFFTPPRHDYPLDATLVLWQYESRIRGGLLYIILRGDSYMCDYIVYNIVYYNTRGVTTRVAVLTAMCTCSSSSLISRHSSWLLIG